MNRFFVLKEDLQEERVVLRGDEFNHLYRSLRHREGDQIEICDGEEGVYLAVIENLQEDRAICSITRRLDYSGEPPVRVKLYQGLPKIDKLELVIQKGVELGVDAVVPFSATRSVVKLTPGKAERRRERWQRIAREAAKQSRRGRVPVISAPLSFAEALKKAKREADYLLVPYEGEEIIYLKQVLTRIESNLKLHGGLKEKLPYQDRPVIAVFIGPEGGFAGEEIRALQSAGGQSVSLGPRILRTETAGIAVLTIIQFQLGDLGDR